MDTCGWCGEPDETCTRCRDCGQHGCVIGNVCTFCGVRWTDEFTGIFATEYWQTAEPYDEYLVLAWQYERRVTAWIRRQRLMAEMLELTPTADTLY